MTTAAGHLDPRPPVSIGQTGLVVTDRGDGMVHVQLASGHGFAVAGAESPRRIDECDRQKLELELAMVSAGVSSFAALADPRHHAAVAERLAAIQSVVPREPPREPGPPREPNPATPVGGE